ncbi:MAG: signal recognition particle-docking protein FtsY [Planctomycetes bacterium]|nr:signal recognition particle-docking protein FtsY [Planctomycetota bacterium]
MRGKRQPKEPVFSDPFERLEHALGKTRGGILDGLRRAIGSQELSEQVIDSLDEILIQADIGPTTTQTLLDGLKESFRKGTLSNHADVLAFLRAQLIERLGGEVPKLAKADSGPTVILVCGVNGAGKTTSIAKLTRHLAEEGHRVLLCASDTFRAAAVEQLRTWAERLSVEIVLGQQNQDPAAVAHDAHEKAVAKNFDYLIIDTAGRLHTDKNLMGELEKIARVGKKHIAESPHEVLLVLDATTGQNGVRQAAAFSESIPVTGLFLAKIDGTARGGIVVVIREELGIPVKFVGLGEQPTDIAPFDATRFIDGLLGRLPTTAS